MINEELVVRHQRRCVACIMICMSLLLVVLFVMTCRPNETVTLPTDPSTVLTEPTTVPTEPSRFEGYLTVFGENSLQSALTGVDFSTITDNDKNVIINTMESLGGTAEFTEEMITLCLDNQSVVFYSDLTTMLIDAEGNSGGTRWIECALSKLVVQPDSGTLTICLSKFDSFAAKYQCDSADTYTAYCAAMNELGWTAQSDSDMVYVAKQTVENVGDCTLTVSFADNVLTIFVQSLSDTTE